MTCPSCSKNKNKMKVLEFSKTEMGFFFLITNTWLHGLPKVAHLGGSYFYRQAQVGLDRFLVL